MTKLYATLTAAALALSLSGIAVAQQDQQPAGQDDAAKREQDYQAALKKCDPMTGAEKQKCIDEAKKKHGQM